MEALSLRAALTMNDRQFLGDVLDGLGRDLTEVARPALDAFGWLPRDDARELCQPGQPRRAGR
jgi:hypothetical protein